MKKRTFKEALKRARQVFKNKDKIKEVFNDAGDKAHNKKDSMGSGLWEDILTLRKMVKAHVAGTYKFSKRTIIYVVAGLIYFINPFDLVPDFILGLGFLDDAAVIGIVIKRVKSDLERFKAETTFDDVEVLS